MSTLDAPGGLLAGVRIIESALLGPGGVAMHLADLGAEVIKVENPSGDYVRKMAFPIVDGISLLHWHLNRGKQSIVLDLKKPEGVAVYRELVRGADAVVEGMRPGTLARLGLGYDQLREVNPKIVFCTHSGYGMTGPDKDMPRHGIAYHAWAGLGRPELFAETPGARYADHARGNVALRRELASIFATRTTAEWVAFSQRVNTPICPVNDVKSITRDPHFQARLALRPHTEAGTDLMPSPIKLVGETLPVPSIAAREPGRDTERVLRDVLGYDDARIAALRDAGALGRH